jgi:ectoine hydroxylase-related dioxygenase (phytanoyl-CoA dioxygenase family)
VSSETAGAEELSERFERDGYVVIPQVLSPSRVEQVNAAIDTILSGEEDAESYNLRAAVERHPAIAELMEEPLPLQIVVNHLGYNLQLHSSLLSIRRPLKSAPDTSERRRLGVGRLAGLDWHRDGPSPQFPRVDAFSAKVCFVISDMSRPGRGNTKVVPGSHKRPEFKPTDADPTKELPGAVEVLGSPGDVFLFTQNLWHAAEPNLSDIERRLIFIGYSAMWARRLEEIEDPVKLLENASPVRRQLVGDIGEVPIQRFVPTDAMLPLRSYWRGPPGVMTYA